MKLNFQELVYMAITGKMDDNKNPIFMFSMADKENLLAILNDEMDVKELVKYELRNRGMNEQGRFVGFNQPSLQ